ncbi:MAG: sensor domain-containing diguanylate cyclase [Acidobacteria bacterium]|nr:sensor domain-containing diguanylate cyclase [Acidobacteriota bacterium]
MNASIAAHGAVPGSFTLPAAGLCVLALVVSAAAILLLARMRSRNLRRLAFLCRISEISVSGGNAAAIFDEIGRELHRNLKFEHVGIGVVGYGRKYIEMRIEAGTSASLTGHRIAFGEGIAGGVAQSGDMKLSQGSGERQGALLRRARSVICLPVVHGETLLGILNAESIAERAFRPADILLFQTLASILAAALHNVFVLQSLQQQAITDSLTGAKTRRYFLESLQAEWKRTSRSGRQFSIVMLDLDRFKELNDSAGHIEGDQALVTVGRLLEQQSRQSNVVARYGGDEFVILMPETALEQAVGISGRLRAAILDSAVLRAGRISASFGVASFPLHGATPEDLLQAADAAMYAAKRRGGNCVEAAAKPAGARAAGS